MHPLLEQFHTQILDPDRIPLALSAMLVTMVLGLAVGPNIGTSNPLIWIVIDRIFGGFGDRLDRPHRPQADLMFRGFLLTAIILFLTLFTGNFIKNQILIRPYYGLIEIAVLSLLLTSGAVWALLLRLYQALEGKKVVPGGYYGLSRSARTNLSIADNLTITRVAMGYSVRSFDKGLVGPVFWYLIAGLPAAMAYAVLACLAWRFGKDGFSKSFGMIPVLFEKLMGFIPNLFTGFLVAFAAAFTPTAGLTRGFLSFFGSKNRAPYEQGGYPLSALAWALNVSLGGATQDITGSAIKGVWTGPEKATAQNDYQHLRRALYINITAHILLMAGLCAAYVWFGRM